MVFCLVVVVEVNVRDVRRGSLGVVDLVVKRGEINGFCRRGRTLLLSSVGSSGADIVVVQLANTQQRWCNARGTCPLR